MYIDVHDCTPNLRAPVGSLCLRLSLVLCSQSGRRPELGQVSPSPSPPLLSGQSSEIPPVMCKCVWYSKCMKVRYTRYHNLLNVHVAFY